MLPASLVEEEPSHLLRTVKVGFIARALAIFRVDEVIVYLDKPKARRHGEFIAEILRYMETPQYLRKRIFPLKKSLQYVGVLPPLRTPHHPIESRSDLLRVGNYREGLVLESNDERSVVDIGVEKPIILTIPNLPRRRRVTVRILKAGKTPKATLVKREEVNVYWGYQTIFHAESLGGVLRKFDGLKIATSRYGDPIETVMGKLIKGWINAKSVCIAFGSPSEGLGEMLSREGLNIREVFDFVVNTVPQQGTKTVRTEEAIYATLAIIRILESLSLD